MKVLHVSRTMGQGGAEKIVFQICKDVKTASHYVASTGGFYADKLAGYDIKHFQIQDLDRKNPLVMWKIYRALSKIIKQEKIDVIHSHHRMAAFYAQLISRSTGVKLVYTAHNIFYNKKKILRFALKNTKIIAVGEGVKKNLIGFYGISRDNISTIYNSVDIKKTGERDALFTELKQKKKFLIGDICRLSKEKGVDIFLRALAKVVEKNDEAVGVVIGDGDERKNLESLAKELRIEKNVHFLGFRENVPDLIAQLDLMVLSSYQEGFPLTPIEVFSQKRTIIASDIPGNRDIIKNKQNGLLFKVGDADDLASKVEYLLAHKNMREDFEEAASCDYNNKYKYDIFIRKYEDAYLKIGSS